MDNSVNNSATNRSSFAETLRSLLTEKEYQLVKNTAARNACNQDWKQNGLYRKYKIAKADGTPLDAGARYFFRTTG